MTGTSLINSKEYWENRFSNGDWEKYDGDLQSAFFSQLAVEGFPDWLKTQLSENNWSVTDWGCAEGGGTAVLARIFPKCRFTGIDFSESAIEKAKRTHAFCEFEVGNIVETGGVSDVVFCSNVLEHMKNPYSLLEKMVSSSKHHVICMLPLHDTLNIEEHFYVFGEEFFPLKIGTHWLSHFRVIDCDWKNTPYWKGKQLLLVYSNGEIYAQENRSLATLYSDQEYAYVKQELTQVQEKLAQSDANVRELLSEKDRELAVLRSEKDTELAALRDELNTAVNKNTASIEALQKIKETLEAEKDLIAASLTSERMKAAKNSEEMKNVQEQLKKTAAEKDALLSELNEKIASLEGELANRDQQISELTNTVYQLTNQYNVLSSQRNSALNQLQAMLQSRLFKLVHFINRLTKQGFHKDCAERKMFRQWLSSRSRHIPNRDHRYNPLFTVISALGGEQQVQQIAVPKPAPVRVTETVAAQDGQLKKHLTDQAAILDEALSAPMSEEARRLREIIDTREYKGILIYPHIVFWEPLQTPQQLLRSFAHEGWLCLFSESPYLEDVYREVEPNIIITHEKDILQAIGDTPATVLLTWMGSMAFVERIRNRKVWYHLLDHLEIFAYYDRYYQALHDNIIDKVDVVSYVAEPLAVCCGGRKDTVYLPNGVHVRDITEKIHPDFVPDDLAPILARGHKIVGYYGYLAEWMDYEMVRFLAETRPEYEFVFIGKAIHDTSLIDSLPNVHLLGLKPYQELFDYAKYFDVATIPFLIDEKMDCVSPIKFYEYMALGLPVVSSSMKELYQFANIHSFVACANNKQEFQFYLDRAMTDEIKEGARAKAPMIAQENSWDARVRHIIPMLSDRDFTMLHDPYVKSDVIILGIIDYSFRHQRPQHFAQRFAKNGHRVFYVNADFKNDYSVTKLEDNLWQVVLPGDAKDFSIHLTDRKDCLSALTNQLDRVVSNFFVRDAVVIVDYPNWVHAAEYMRNQYGFKVITDYMDDFTGFLNPAADLVRENCIKLLKMSDSVIASSQFLYDIAVKYNDHVSISRNGTEYEYFHKAANAGVKKKDRPIIGYYGAIAEWFAADIVCRCAERFPDCDVVLVGAITEHREKFEKHKNIKLIGEVPYSELLPWLESFDVCLIPFDTSTDLIKATNPVKFYEYLSAGKKIVATEIPELEPYRDQFAYLENDTERFCDRVQDCLNGKDQLAGSEECYAFAAQNDWDCRAADFEREMYRIYPKISAVVLCYNQLDYTKECVESILSQTAYPNYELIIVDNNSTDQTADYLKEVAEQYSNVKIVLNKTNRGFAGGNNDGLAVADGEYLVLLNNDTVVTRGWLTGLVKHYNSDEPVGLVGPVTNSIGNEAKIPTYYYQIGEMPAFAFQYTQEHMGEEYPHQGILAMYCLMISRECYEKVGPLDENYGVGMFEDDDYTYAARHHGFKAVMAEDVFVHHYGSVSFKALEEKMSTELHKTNRAYFEKKWKKKWKQPMMRGQFKA